MKSFGLALDGAEDYKFENEKYLVVWSLPALCGPLLERLGFAASTLPLFFFKSSIVSLARLYAKCNAKSMEYSKTAFVSI